jgi:hypothetical protein
LSDAGFVGWCIILTGIAGGALVYERSRVLFKQYSMDAEIHEESADSGSSGKIKEL